MERPSSPEQIHPEKEQNREKRIIRKPCQFLQEVGITDFHYEEKKDGVHFFIKLPPEHIEYRRKQIASHLNPIDSTDFESGPLYQFTEKLNQTKNLAWRFLPGQAAFGSETEF